MSAAHVDLEQGRTTYHHHHHYLRRTGLESIDDEEEDCRSICFSEADDGNSCHSTFYSTAGVSFEDIRFTDHEVVDGLVVSRRDSSVSDCSVEVVILGEDGDVKVHLDESIRVCRICHLSLGIGSNVIELGCDCKNDLAIAHSNCAERWFKIKGNRICEICNSTAENVNVATNEMETIVTALSVPPPSTAESSTRNLWKRHRFLNFLLACMVFALVVSWLFHFNAPS